MSDPITDLLIDIGIGFYIAIVIGFLVLIASARRGGDRHD